jgi:predicted PurR-regulated permease PerM
MIRQGTEINFLKVLQTIFFGSLILYLGKSFLVPLCFALFISFILYPICKWLERKKIPSVLAALIATCLLSVLLVLIGVIFIKQISSLYQQWPLIQVKLYGYMKSGSVFLSEIMDFSLEQQKEWLKNFLSGGANQALSLIWSSSGSFAMFILVPVYASLILIYRNTLFTFLVSMIPADAGSQLHAIILEAVTSYYNFIRGMIIVYFIVGILNSIGLYFLSIPNPFFFGFIASILTIVPYIGITVGAILPVTMAWVSHDSIWYPLGVVIVFSFVQILEANIIFPLAVGNRLKINPLSIIVVVMLGGFLWGPSGMILFIPFIAVLKLISDKIPSWKPLSLLLKG